MMRITCPLCKKEAPWEKNPFRPFCSERCKLIDLGKWAAEDYRIAGEKKDLPDEGSEGIPDADSVENQAKE